VKPKTESRSHYFKPLDLNLEDIEEIVAIISETCRDVQVSDDKNVYDSLEEMGNRLGKRVHLIHIEAVDPYISITLGTKRLMRWVRTDNNSLYVANSEKGHALFFRVRDIIAQHQRLLVRFFNYPVFMFLLTVDICFTWFRRTQLRLSPITITTISWVDDIVVYGYVSIFFYFYLRGKSRLSLIPYDKRESFWERNLDSFSKILFGAVIGILGTLVTEWLKRAVFTK
jgi:hypothetical protein